MDEFVYSTDDEFFESYDIVMLNLESEYEPGTKITISRGKPRPFTHATFIDGARLIENMQESAYDGSGEVSVDYLDGISKEKVTELELVIADWFSKNVDQPTFYGVTDIEEITVTVEY